MPLQVTEEEVSKAFEKAKVKSLGLDVLVLIESLRKLSGGKSKKEFVIAEWRKRSNSLLVGYDIAGYSIMRLHDARSYMDSCSTYDARNWKVKVLNFYRLEETPKLEKKLQTSSP